MVNLLIKRGANLEARTYRGWSPLQKKIVLKRMRTNDGDIIDIDE